MGFCGGSFEMIGNAPWSCMEDDSRRPESCWRRGTLRLVSRTVVLASGRSGCVRVSDRRVSADKTYQTPLTGVSSSSRRIAET
jgi:hypothetical protein